MDWAQIILGFMTVLLVALIVVAVVLVVFLIKLSRQIKTVSSNMGQTAKSFDDSAKKLNRFVATSALVKTAFSKMKKSSKNSKVADDK